MRLYIKLFAFILAAASLQRFCLSSEPPSELWFGLKCEFAYMTDNDELLEKLIVEARYIQAYEDAIIVNAAG